MGSFGHDLESFRTHRELSGVDCGDRVCELSYHFEQVCKLFLPTNNSQCKIPCLETGCDFEIHKMVQCPVWTCEHYTTTTSTSTSSSPTTAFSNLTTSSPPLSTTLSPDSTDSSTYLYISLGFNVVFIILSFVTIAFWLKKKYLAYRLRTLR
jgi:hypothetical protein